MKVAVAGSLLCETDLCSSNEIMSCGGSDGFIVEKMVTIEKHPELPEALSHLTMRNSL